MQAETDLNSLVNWLLVILVVMGATALGVLSFFPLELISWP